MDKPTILTIAYALTVAILIFIVGQIPFNDPSTARKVVAFLIACLYLTPTVWLGAIELYK